MLISPPQAEKWKDSENSTYKADQSLFSNFHDYFICSGRLVVDGISCVRYGNFFLIIFFKGIPAYFYKLWMGDNWNKWNKFIKPCLS